MRPFPESRCTECCLRPDARDRRLGLGPDRNEESTVTQPERLLAYLLGQGVGREGVALPPITLATGTGTTLTTTRYHGTYYR